MGSRRGSDDEPGDEFEVGGFAGLLLHVGNLEAAIRLQADGDAFWKVRATESTAAWSSLL